MYVVFCPHVNPHQDKAVVKVNTITDTPYTAHNNHTHYTSFRVEI